MIICSIISVILAVFLVGFCFGSILDGEIINDRERIMQ